MPIIYIYISIYIYSEIFLVVYFGIYGNNRSPGDRKMAEKEKNALCIQTKLFILLWLKKKERERDYTLKNGLYNSFER